MDELKPRSANSIAITPLEFLERAATVYGECASIVYNDTTYTWSDTHCRCLQLASSIASLGIKRGEVVSVVAPNIPAMYELQFSVPMSGAILNNINTRLDAHTISVLLQHSESKLIFVDYLLQSMVLEALAMFPPDTPRPVLILITDDEVSIGLTVDFHSTYESLVERGDPGFEWIRPESEWDPIVLNYTSGTTSSPKGVVQSHRAIFIFSLNTLIDWSVPKQPVYLWTLPIFHANGWCLTWAIAAVGGTNICLRKFDAPIVYNSIYNHNVTHMCGAPVVLNMLTNFPNAKATKSPVEIIVCGAPPPAEVLFRAESLGFVVTHGYGLTETAGPVVSCAWKPQWNGLPAVERARLKARQGVRTIGLTEVEVLDLKSGARVKRNGSTVGEIVLRGVSVMLGYFKDKEETDKCMSKNGWFYTGDVGVIHQDGYIEIKDRSKDVIISGGENVSSVEVESVLYTHPAVNEVAVVARPDEFWGETPCAFVSLKPETGKKTTETEIKQYCKKKLPGYMVPKTVVVREELPKTSTGKIQKYLLRDIAKTMDMSSQLRVESTTMSLSRDYTRLKNMGTIFKVAF